MSISYAIVDFSHSSICTQTELAPICWKINFHQTYLAGETPRTRVSRQHANFPQWCCTLFKILHKQLVWMYQFLTVWFFLFYFYFFMWMSSWADLVIFSLIASLTHQSVWIPVAPSGRFGTWANHWAHRFTMGAACMRLLPRVKGVIHKRFLCDVCHLMRRGFDSGLNHWLTEQDYSLGGNMWPFELDFSNLFLLYRAQLGNILASFREKHTVQVRSLHTLLISMEVELIWGLLMHLFLHFLSGLTKHCSGNI